MKTVFVFPKSFEFFKFLTYLLDNHHILDIQQKDEYEYHIIWFNGADESIVYRFEVLLINDSDINFYGLFSKLLENVGYIYILIGSCGSHKTNDIGNCYYVNRAFKGDRGRLTADSNFIYEERKRAKQKHRLW